MDLGLERSGMVVRWQSEIDPYASKVLAKHWPHVPNLGDITTIDWSTVERVDLICGGYPCQPFSLAGVRRGESDPRHLWPYFAAAVRELRPRWALLENVPGHLSLGFGRVLGDLAELGYDCEWECIPAAAVGAPHLRYRVFVVAHTDSESEPGRAVDGRARRGLMVPDPIRRRLRQQPVPQPRSSTATIAAVDGSQWQVAHSEGGGRQGLGIFEAPRYGRPGSTRRGPAIGGTWPPEPDVGRVAHGVPARMDRLRCLGNAVVPQVAEWIGRQIVAAHLAEVAA